MADYYATLEIGRSASEDEIKSAYRKLAMRYHPDRNNGSADAEEKFKQITEAYDVLRDPNKRAAYDRFGEAGLRGGGMGGGFHHVDLSEALGIFMRDFGGGFSGLDELFGNARGGGSVRTGADIKLTLQMTLAEAATGVEKTVTAKLLDPCDRCTGSGAEPGTSSQVCTTCSGAGEVRRAQRSFFGQFVTVAPCPTCKGEGRIVKSPCKKCRGEGRVRGEKQIAIKVPAGVATNQYMTLRGVGNAGARGGERGDVHVIFEVADDPRFERDGEELFTEVMATFPQLVMGADLKVPLLSGEMMLQIPPATQSGQVFHLRGRGLPRVNGGGTGDLHVRVQLWTPEKLSDEERALVQKLDELRPTVPDDAGRGKGFWARVKEQVMGA
ncbi:MAG TPA: molecular chaperone DnaJ [Gemmatimonadaceae bacterium]|jgi:molecular chaperone DnaJ